MASVANDRLAVLIDADNAQASIVSELLTEISRYGTASVKRAYGDWTTPNLKGWKGHLQARDTADPAIQLHVREERDGLLINH